MSVPQETIDLVEQESKDLLTMYRQQAYESLFIRREKRGLLVEVTYPDTKDGRQAFKELKKNIKGTTTSEIKFVLVDNTSTLAQGEAYFFENLSNIWEKQKAIQKLIQEGKTVFVHHYTFQLSALAEAFNWFNLKGGRDNVAVSWLFGVFKGLVVPDLVIMIAEDHKHLEPVFKEKIESMDFPARTTPEEYRSSALYHVEEAKMNLLKLVPDSHIFHLSDMVSPHGVMFRVAYKGADASYCPIKIY